jgi:hypothetical protein
MNLFKLISLTFESKNIAQVAFKNNMYILISMKVILLEFAVKLYMFLYKARNEVIAMVIPFS